MREVGVGRDKRGRKGRIDGVVVGLRKMGGLGVMEVLGREIGAVLEGTAIFEVVGASHCPISLYSKEDSYPTAQFQNPL